MAEAWKVSGTYFEACNCETACPCVFLSPPTKGHCTVLVGWHIDEGHLGEGTLGGLNVALAVHSPGNMAHGKWKAVLYLDTRATEAQKGVLTQIFSGQVGGHPAVLGSFVEEVLGVSSVVIDYQAEGKRRRLQIPDIAEVEIEALAGQGNTEVTISNHPLCVSPGYPAVVAKSTQVRYHDHGLQLDVSEKNGYYAPFSYQGA
jgi:hypothetical protein